MGILLLICYFLLFAIFAIFLGLLIYVRWNFGSLEKLNIPIDPPNFFLGSDPDMHKKKLHETDLERFQKFGPVFGIYEGRVPQIFICDPDLIHYILVQDYDHFHNKRVLDIADPIYGEIIDFQQDEKWKILRSMWTPFFTVGKLKKMNESFVKSSKLFCNHIRMECKKSSNGKYKANMNEQSACFIVESTARSVYGMNIDTPYDPKNFFVATLRTLIGHDLEPSFMMTLFTTVLPFMMSFDTFQITEQATKFCQLFLDILDERRKTYNKNTIKSDDIIDKFNDMLDKLDTEEFKRAKVTKKSVVAQIVTILLGGYDQMTTAINVLAYNMAINEEIEEKLLKEIDTFVQKRGENYSHENLKELVYLNACLSESLRIAPPLYRLERMCTKTWERNGVHIPKGLMVNIPLFAIHHNPEIFPNPGQFEPERFMPDNLTKNVEKAFLTFGNGPKNCVGMKFAYEIMMMGLLVFLKEFKFAKRPETKLEFLEGSQMILKLAPLYLDIVQRVES